MEKLHESTNEVQVVGYLQEVDLTDGTDKNGKPYVRGKVIIRVSQSYSGRTEESEIPVSIYASQYTNKGGVNPAYQNIKQLEGWKRITVDGDDADRVQFSGNSARIREYAFIPEGRTDPVSNWQIGASFFQKVTGEMDSRAVFKNQIYIRSIENEVRNDEETGRLVVKGILVTYGGAANVITYYVEDKRAIDYISNNYREGDTVTVGGRVRCSAEVRSVTPREAEGFGDEVDTGVSRVVSELIITTGSPAGSDENPFDEDAIREAMGARQQRIQESAANRKNAASTSNRATTNRRASAW